MRKKETLVILVTLLLIGTSMVAFNIQPVKASGTIYVRADGSIDPPTAPIASLDNVTYTFARALCLSRIGDSNSSRRNSFHHAQKKEDSKRS